MDKVLLAYSGGLDTSVAIKMIKEKYRAEIITLTVDVGQNEDLYSARDRALKIGAKQAFVLNVQEEFVADYVFPALKANALYEGIYPLATALARPLIVRHLVDFAHQVNAQYIAHGCTGKGNDQVRLEASLAALDPRLKIIAPVREFNLKRNFEVEYARKHGIPVESKATVYSIDENLWGRSIECGPLEDAGCEPPEDAYAWTASPQSAPDDPTYVEIGFKAGVPVVLDRSAISPLNLVQTLNRIGGENGVGRLDHVESRLVGIKSREVYEAPAASILLQAHQDLEKLVLARDLLHFKPLLENCFSELVYNGQWFSPLRKALVAFFEQVQDGVNGTVKVKLYKGNVTVTGRASEKSLYVRKLATYDGADDFDQTAAKGFIDIWSLPLKVYAQVHSTDYASTNDRPAVLAQGEKE